MTHPADDVPASLATSSPHRWRTRFLAAATRPVDAASLVVLRWAFGLLMAASGVRYLAAGWVERSWVQPTTFFQYWGFGWVHPLPEPWTTVLYVVSVGLALLMAAGRCWPWAPLGFLLVFGWLELGDVTNYLNHYYLASLLTLLFVFLPLGHRAWTQDGRPAHQVPAWMLWLFRFQVGVVYVYAGVAKLGTDWLLHAQPLNIWLQSRIETPLLGPLFAYWEVALAMSWAGALHDLLIVPALLWSRTRPWAYATLLVFHGLTRVLFQIGIFPVLMAIAASSYLDPAWPRRFSWATAWLPARPALDRSASCVQHWLPPRATALATAAFVAWQVLVPLRTFAYPGDVLWHEQGMRWSWRVMVRKKEGAVTYAVRYAGRDRPEFVSPRRYLTAAQEREMAGQPDLILQLAHRIAEDFRANGHADVEVRVDAWASLNGRAPAQLIDPTVDLAQVRDGLGRADWILAAPTEPPPRLRRFDGTRRADVAATSDVLPTPSLSPESP